MTTKNEMKRALFDAYDGFAEKRLKNIENDAPFIVDDRSSGDFGADKQLFLWFCQMFVEVNSGDCIQVTMRGGLPDSADVAAWFDTIGAQDDARGKTFEIGVGQQDALLDLADRMEAIIAPGKRYPVAAYKYVCPRTAGSLRRMHSVIDKVWS